MPIVLVLSFVLTFASPALASAPCECTLSRSPVLARDLSGVPRNARFFVRSSVAQLHEADGVTPVATDFAPAPGDDTSGWLVPRAPLAARAAYQLDGQRFSTGDDVDTAPPTVRSVTSTAAFAGGCGLHAARKLVAIGYEDDHSVPQGSFVIMRIDLRANGGAVRSVYMPADDAVLAAFASGDLPSCGQLSWDEHDAELVATVTLIDQAGNTSAPSAALAFRLDVNGDASGCAIGGDGGAPAAAFVVVLALGRRRRLALTGRARSCTCR